MARKGKRLRTAAEGIDRNAFYDLGQAVKLIKARATAKFDETVEIAMNLNVDPRKADQNVRGTVMLPHGTGKTLRVAVFARGDRAKEALAYLEKSVQLDPRSPIMVWEIGDLHRDLRHYDEAATAFRRAAELAPADLEYGFELNSVPFYARGSTKEMEAWLAQIRPAQAGDLSPLFYRREWARLRGDYATAVNLDREHPYLDPFDDPHFRQDVMFVLDLVGQGDAAGARERARLLAPAMNRLVETQSSNGFAWLARGWCYATLGEKEEALRSMRRARELLPESLDAKSGPEISLFATGVLAWSGDKDTALAELARLLRTPRGANVHQLRAGIFWQPLRGDPRFEALLNDPKNNQPLF